jgi:hypothetical protein
MAEINFRNAKVYYKNQDNKFVQGTLRQVKERFVTIENKNGIANVEKFYLTKDDVLNNKVTYCYDVISWVLTKLGWEFGNYGCGNRLLYVYIWQGNTCLKAYTTLAHYTFDLDTMHFTYIAGDIADDVRQMLFGVDIKSKGKTEKECKEKNKIIFVDEDDEKIMQDKIESVQNEIDECTRKLNALRQTLADLQN